MDKNYNFVLFFYFYFYEGYLTFGSLLTLFVAQSFSLLLHISTFVLLFPTNYEGNKMRNNFWKKNYKFCNMFLYYSIVISDIIIVFKLICMVLYKVYNNSIQINFSMHVTSAFSIDSKKNKWQNIKQNKGMTLRHVSKLEAKK